MTCCRRPGGIQPYLLKEIEAILASDGPISEIFPGTTAYYVFDAQGRYIFKPPGIPDNEVDELSIVISSLCRAATQFSDTLNQMECPVIHIKGTENMFSAYDLGDNYLAFYSNLSGPILEGFETTIADKAMSPIISRLHELLQRAFE
eukprot:TRINITY_DN4464_c0_g1::TRINITY_DN4464_c0_g1_i1::g.7337::m.7337 TRINITY_DN4464_c0_g1::TRINITY_DN4464_c0_g1_i1::g.7337  ORF type:complete len:147 (+),score=1.20,DUF2665/PF11654.3/1.2,DUF2665/PF11654.3/5.2e+02 TRINITY_DN4464_c0_g1_i1:88-528(+)